MNFISRAEDFLSFVNSSRSAFHAVESAKVRLAKHGFVGLSERDHSSFASIRPGGKYWFTRNQSSLVAFTVGKQWKSGNPFTIVGAHTDSPVLKVKPVSNVVQFGYCQVGVECYGGGLWYTWFDRDLTVAGRVLVATKDGFESKLVYIDRPIMRVPSLAIHLDRGANDSFAPNKETSLVPVLGSVIKQTLENTVGKDGHNTALVALLAEKLSIAPEDIQNFELTVCDYQDSVIGGLNNEYIFSGRLDNLMSSFCGIEALCEASSDQSLEKDGTVRMVALFDNEEVGSQSSYGAMSPIVEDAIERISVALAALAGDKADILTSKSNSFIISADMAHAVHPNFGTKHENNHRPEMNKGPVIKTNSNQRYATTSESSLVIELLCKRHDIPVQKFVVRNDAPCGSTIGPILSSGLGVRTVDIGNPQLSMHSIREMCGVEDTTHCINLMKAFFEEFVELDKTIKID